MRQALLFGAIASVLTLNAFANQVLTSQTYVDNADALKQNKIPVTGTNTATPGDTVVTYTSTAGTIGERGIFNMDTDYDWDNYSVETGHEGDLVTAYDLGWVYNSIPEYSGTPNSVAMYNSYGYFGASREIYNGSSATLGTTYDPWNDQNKLMTAGAIKNSMTTVTYKTCTRWMDGQSHTDANCLLWDLTDKTVYGPCVTNADCQSIFCANGTSHMTCDSSLGQCVCS